MRPGNEKTELERKLEKAKEGYASLAEGMPPFAFAERGLGRNEVNTRFQRGPNLFAEARRMREEQRLAMERLRPALPSMKQVHGEAKHVARKHFGADAKTIGTFGVTSPERGERRRRGHRGERGGEVLTEVVKDLFLEEEVVTCEEQAPQRGCGPSQALKRRVKRGCDPSKGRGPKLTKRVR